MEDLSCNHGGRRRPRVGRTRLRRAMERFFYRLFGGKARQALNAQSQHPSQGQASSPACERSALLMTAAKRGLVIFPQACGSDNGDVLRIGLSIQLGQTTQDKSTRITVEVPHGWARRTDVLETEGRQECPPLCRSCSGHTNDKPCPIACPDHSTGSQDWTSSSQ